MPNTPYAKELKRAEDAFGQRIERLYVHEKGREEIRFSWRKNGQFMIRPLDLPECELLPLLETAIGNQVFSDDFLRGLLGALSAHLSRRDYERCVEELQSKGDHLPKGTRETRSLLEVLDSLEPLDEDWPEIDDPPPEPVRL